MDAGLIEEFARVGGELYASGSVSTHGGNLSVRAGDGIVITRRGAMLGHLGADTLLQVALEAGSADDGASRELIVHRAIYAATSAGAVVHAHPVNTIARSLVVDEIVPADSEAAYVLGTVPVISCAETIGSAEVAALASEALRTHPIVVVRGHGPFAAGDTLEQAHGFVSVLESACAVANLLDSMGRPVLGCE